MDHVSQTLKDIFEQSSQYKKVQVVSALRRNLKATDSCRHSSVAKAPQSEY